MRAPFDILVDLYWGPSNPLGGALRVANVPARFVPDECFVDVYEPLDGSLAYLTMDATLPLGPAVLLDAGERYVVDYGFADRVSIPAGGEPVHAVVRVETRTWPVNVDYWRAHVSLLPLRIPISVGCDTYHFSPWGVDVSRSGPLSWGEPEMPLVTDGFGNWYVYDIEDDCYHVASGWDGHGTKTFSPTGVCDGDVDVICGD